MMSFLWRERGGGVAGAVGKKVNDRYCYCTFTHENTSLAELTYK